MVNFKTLVEKVLLNEAVVGVPAWFQIILNKHKDLFGPEITDEDLSDFFDLLDDTKISEIEGLKDYGKLRILDLMKNYYDSMDPKPKDLNDFKTKLETMPNLVQITNKMDVPNLNISNKSKWSFTNSKIADLEQRAKQVADKQAISSFSAYTDKSILGALQEIINKRINVFSRVANLKSPTQPFNKLIIDIFKTPEQYLSGEKKYSSDFEAVDKMYITDVIDIAIASKEFFASEIGRLKLAPKTSTPTESPVPAEVFAMGDSLNNFQNLVNSILLNELNIKKSLSNLKQKATDWEKYYLAKPEVKERYKKIKETLKQDDVNYLNFISGKPIQYKLVDPETGNVLQPEQIKTTDPKEYTLGKINDLKTIESKKLIDSIKKLTTYITKKPGAGERLQQLGQLGSNIAAAAGAKLYG